MLEHELVGKHVSKSNTFFSTVKNYRKKSIQIFTGSPRSWVRKDSCSDDIFKTKDYVENNKIYFFIHSLYFINLARDDPKQIKNLNWELSTGLSIGSKGVVVHVGKHLGNSGSTERMYKNIMKLDIDPDCPLLLETPAGQGTECLVDIDEFIKFVKRFDNRLKVCIDTCHVWAAGYIPIEYIEKFVKEVPDKLVLVHFNDSKTEKGSRKDRHEFPGKGFIGSDEMNKVFHFCEERKIPMVIE